MSIIELTTDDAARLINEAAAVILDSEPGRPVLYLELDTDCDELFHMEYDNEGATYGYTCSKDDNPVVEFDRAQSTLLLKCRPPADSCQDALEDVRVLLLKVGHDWSAPQP